MWNCERSYLYDWIHQNTTSNIMNNVSEVTVPILTESKGGKCMHFVLN